MRVPLTPRRHRFSSERQTQWQTSILLYYIRQQQQQQQMSVERPGRSHTRTIIRTNTQTHTHTCTLRIRESFCVIIRLYIRYR